MLLTNLRMYRSRNANSRNTITHIICGDRGQVKIVAMKVLNRLWRDLLSQVYSKHLSIYVQIGLMEQGNLLGA